MESSRRRCHLAWASVSCTLDKEQLSFQICFMNLVAHVSRFSINSKMEHAGECRQHPADGNYERNRPELGACEDCRVLPIAETRTVHYTACKKPWQCTLPYPRIPGPAMKAHTYRLQQLTNVTTCGLLFRKYFELRRDVEDRIAAAAGKPVSARTGTFHPEYFLGYCQKGRYINMELPDGFDMNQVYGF